MRHPPRGRASQGNSLEPAASQESREPPVSPLSPAKSTHCTLQCRPKHPQRTPAPRSGGFEYLPYSVKRLRRAKLLRSRPAAWVGGGRPVSRRGGAVDFVKHGVVHAVPAESIFDRRDIHLESIGRQLHAIGESSGKVGNDGDARAAKLSPGRRKEIAQKAQFPGYCFCAHPG